MYTCQCTYKCYILWNMLLHNIYCYTCILYTYKLGYANEAFTPSQNICKQLKSIQHDAVSWGNVYFIFSVAIVFGLFSTEGQFQRMRQPHPGLRQLEIRDHDAGQRPAPAWPQHCAAGLWKVRASNPTLLYRRCLTRIRLWLIENFISRLTWKTYDAVQYMFRTIDH